MANKIYTPDDVNLNSQLEEILNKGVDSENLSTLNYIELVSPNNKVYRLTVDDEGNLLTEEV